MLSDWVEYSMVEEGLLALQTPPRSDLGEVVDYVLSTPGKRTRPLILIFSAEAFGSPPRRSLNAALAVELAHAASLVHDDILDGGVERRGAPTTVERFGLEAALLCGDYLISRSIDLISHYPGEVIRTFANACMEMSAGEMLDLSRISSPKEYFRCVSSKTASLFAASARMGCMIAKVGDEQASIYHEYGLHLGLAYQIVDDLEEVLGTSQGKRSLKTSSTLPRIHGERGSLEEAVDICTSSICEHVEVARDALARAGGSEKMRDRLNLILNKMTGGWSEECVLQRSLC